MEFRAVVLAAGKGSRMVDLTSQMPKCLLPVGGLPMIWYPLRMLQDAGFDKALVVISEQMREYRSQLLAIPQLHNLHISIDLCEVASREDPGTADSLRQLAAERLRSCPADLLVVSCDLVTAAPLRRLLDIHRLEDATVTALFASPHPETGVTGVTAPGPKSRHKPEHDLIGISHSGSRLCLLASEADFEEEVRLRLALLRRHPRLVIRRDLLDGHLYLLAAGMLDWICEAKHMTSLKGEVIPHIIRSQFRRVRDKDASLQQQDEQIRAKNSNDFLRPARFAHLTEKFTPPSERREVAACFAETTEARTWRTNTIAAYLKANREAVRLWEEMPTPKPERIHPSATVPQSKVQIGETSIIGASSALSEKTTLISTVIGRHCSLGGKVRLSECVLMDHVTVADEVSLTNCILMPHCTVEKGAELKDCIVGVKQVVKEGAKKSREVISKQGSNMEVY